MSNQIIDPEEVLRIVRRIVSTRYAVIGHRHDAADINGLSSGGGGGGSDTAWGDITGAISSQADLQAALDGKQSSLVSGTSIKTVNGTALLGAGDVVISGGVALSSAIVTIPSGRGVYEYSAVITDASVNSGHSISCELAPHLDSDENGADMLSLRSITAVAGTGNFVVDMSFDDRTCGVVRFRYFKT